jgi:pimeloyl-ACP methyl ester carboxylesterase
MGHRAAAAWTVLATVLLAVACAGCQAGSAAPSGASGAGSSGGTPASSGAAAGAALSWHPCSGQQRSMQCANLQVPLDYGNPSGRKITLALSRILATAPASQRQGVLLVNPGGPGASGLALAGQVADGLSPAVAAEYDIIGFDPRGVGSSVPALHCDTSFFAGVRPDYIPRTSRDEQVLEARAKAYAADCERSDGWLLPYMTTENAARDMDSIRVALGQQKINYFAYSYGTYLGQVYATLFPSRIRRMVLDSVVGPGGVWYQDNIDQDYAFQGRIIAFFSWIASHDDVYHLGTTAAQVQQAWYRARAQLAAHPISGPAGPMIGPDEFDDTFLQGGYFDGLWPGLAAALSAYENGGGTGQMISQYKAYGAQNENEFAVYTAVECADVAWPRDWARWDRDTRAVYRTAPFQAWDNAWFNAACAYWPVQGPASPPQIKGSGLPGILMIQGTLDAATPYAGAQQAHRLLPTARMVVVVGGGNHGQSLDSPPNACVDGYVDRYLAGGALPQGAGLVNATCPALPAPPPLG